jgi:opacity protein-like surface antigen
MTCAHWEVRFHMKKLLWSSLVLALLAAPAAAQTRAIVTPFVGLTTNTPSDENRTVYGGSFGVLGNVVGFEGDFGYTPNFFELEDDFGEFDPAGSVTTAMGNLLLATPGRFRLYGTVGAGLMRSNLKLFDFFDDLSRNDFGINYGGGLMIFFSENLAIRGDLRQFRSLQNTDVDDDFPEPRDFDLGDFKFWRATAGVTFKF